VILWPDGRSQLFTSFLEETSALTSGSEVKAYKKSTERDRMLESALKGVERVGICGAGLTYRMLQGDAQVDRRGGGGHLEGGGGC